MKFDYSKLRGKIIEKYGSQTAFAKEFGISKNVFSKKMNNKTRFNPDDMIKIVKMLDIPEKDINTYFFAPKV